MRIIKKLLIITVVFILAACTRSASEGDINLPTVSISASATPVVADTVVAIEATEMIVGTATFPPTTIPQTPTERSGKPPATPTTSLPKDKPLKSWQEIPVMTGAITGEELDDRYRFLIETNVDQVEEYYKKELTTSGWKFVTAGTGENGAPIFIFSKGKSTLSISVIVLGKMAVVTLAPI